MVAILSSRRWAMCIALPLLATVSVSSLPCAIPHTGINQFWVEAQWTQLISLSKAPIGDYNFRIGLWY